MVDILYKRGSSYYCEEYSRYDCLPHIFNIIVNIFYISLVIDYTYIITEIVIMYEFYGRLASFAYWLFFSIDVMTIKKIKLFQKTKAAGELQLYSTVSNLQR